MLNSYNIDTYFKINFTFTQVDEKISNEILRDQLVSYIAMYKYFKLPISRLNPLRETTLNRPTRASLYGYV